MPMTTSIYAIMTTMICMESPIIPSKPPIITHKL